MIIESGNVDMSIFDMNLRVMAMNNWNQVWINMIISAINEMSDILIQHDKKQYILLQQRGRIPVSSDHHPIDVIEKMLSGNVHNTNTNTTITTNTALDISNSDEKLLIPTISQFKQNLENEENEILNLEQQLVDNEVLYDITNRLTFHRLISFSSDMLHLDINLTSFATVSMKLNVKEDINNKFMITDTDVDLLLQDSDNLQQSNAENSLIAAFFTHILANDEKKGPLSVAHLTTITEIGHLPSVLQAVSVNICLLRKAIKALEPALMKGGNYIVIFSNGELLIRVFGPNRSSVITSPLIPFLVQVQRMEDWKTVPDNEVRIL